MSTAGPTSWVDALHVGLLADAHELTAHVARLKTDLPKIVADVQGSAELVRQAGAACVQQFDETGYALAAMLKEQADTSRAEAVKANAASAGAAARAIEAANERLTKYLWAVVALTSVNVLVGLVTLLRQ